MICAPRVSSCLVPVYDLVLLSVQVTNIETVPYGRVLSITKNYYPTRDLTYVFDINTLTVVKNVHTPKLQTSWKMCEFKSNRFYKFWKERIATKAWHRKRWKNGPTRKSLIEWIILSYPNNHGLIKRNRIFFWKIILSFLTNTNTKGSGLIQLYSIDPTVIEN